MYVSIELTLIKVLRDQILLQTAKSRKKLIGKSNQTRLFV